MRRNFPASDPSGPRCSGFGRAVPELRRVVRYTVFVYRSNRRCALASSIFSTGSLSASISIQTGWSCLCASVAASRVLQMGRRGGIYSDDNTPGWLQKFPEGGYASLESIRADEWTKFEPQPVRIPASRFVQIDSFGMACYFDLKAGEFIQGLIATIMSHSRVYVVTVPAPQEHATYWSVWPRIVQRRPTIPR